MLELGRAVTGVETVGKTMPGIMLRFPASITPVRNGRGLTAICPIDVTDCGAFRHCPLVICHYKHVIFIIYDSI